MGHLVFPQGFSEVLYATLMFWEEGGHLTTHSLKCLVTLSLVAELTLFSVLFAILVYFPVLCF